MDRLTRQQLRFKKRNGGVRTVGFDAMPNGRNNARRAALVVGYIAAGIKPDEAEARSWRALAATLAAPRMVRNTRPVPSKGDKPEYRREGGPERVK